MSIEEVVFTDLNIYPNPTTDYATIDVSLTETQEVVVEVVNTLGQKVLNITTVFDAGVNSFELPVSKLNTGLYYVSVKVSGETVTKELNIIK